MIAMATVRSLARSLLPAPAIALYRRLYWWSHRRPRPVLARRKIRRLLATKAPLKLELGSGPRIGMEDWTSVDLNIGADIQWDLSTPLPFPANSIDAIYSSHMLEHFTYPTPMLSLLRDCHRILKPGGSFSVAVPNARLFLAAYEQPEGFDVAKFCSHDVGLHFTSPIDVVNFIAYLGGEHRFMFDERNLPLVLEEGGFRSAEIRQFDPSTDLEQRRHESIYAIALK
jgi:predicted SAM-dependent methyltransferase